jgi:hypothetical protein
VHNFFVSLDDFGTDIGQSVDAAFRHADGRLLEWFFATCAFRLIRAKPGGTTGVDYALASRWAPGIGAEIMGRYKFGLQRGRWPGQKSSSEEWKG